ncbi:MAG: Na/Pi cotransporter family protein [Bacteroidales bacterium]|nr:Na/Pi cotransporter family protein [Bacteroidales bacterium]
MDNSIEINWFSVIAGALGGLVFFLLGMELMSNGLKSSLGTNIRNILTKLNKNRFASLVTGILLTMVTQSTGATTIMMLSFVETNLMSFFQTIPVILGANIGSTFTSQMIAFDITAYAILPVIVGFLLKTAGFNDKIRDAGSAILGFGLVFYGMKLLSISVSDLKEMPQFLEMVSSASNPVIGVLVGTLATAIMQSSCMFTGILMVFAKEGLMGLDEAFPLIIGSGIGTSLLVVLAAMGSSRQSKRTMIAHLFVKIVPAFIFVPLTPLLVMFLDWLGVLWDISPERQIANTHTLYMFGSALVILPFTKSVARLIEKICPDRPIPEDNLPHLRYIDINVDVMPQSAIELSISETATLIKLTGRMFDKSLKPLLEYNPDNPETIRAIEKTITDLDIKENKLDYIEVQIRNYLFAVGRRKASNLITSQIFSMISILEQTERMGDVIHRGIKPLYNKLIALGKSFSHEGHDEIAHYYNSISSHFNSLIAALTTRDTQKIAVVAADTKQTADLAESLRLSHIKRLWDENPNVELTHEIHMQLIDDLADLATLLYNISSTFSRSILPEDGDL